MKVGFIGLGIMGKPMARNLMRAGHELVVHSRSRPPVDELSEEGATPLATPRAVAEASEAVITMLPDSPDVREAMLGERGVLAGAAESSLAIDMSTISPLVAREVAAEAGARGVGALDAPVSGGESGAIEGRLSIMVGGPEQDFARAEELLSALGTPTHVGEAGAGQVTKACNQIVIAAVIEALSEALVLGSKAGVDPSKMIRALGAGLAGTRVMEVKQGNFLEHDFEPGFRVELHHKDLGIALATARELGVALPVTALVDQMLATLEQRGRGTEDHSALMTLLEEAAGHRVGDGA
jgi:2-hydroxy-3-oxopropionate reductase